MTRDEALEIAIKLECIRRECDQVQSIAAREPDLIYWWDELGSLVRKALLARDSYVAEYGLSLAEISRAGAIAVYGKEYVEQNPKYSGLEGV